jgi:hypothetical protein
LTPAQIEAAARELCRTWGQDPEEQMGEAGPRWRIVVPEIERFCEIGTAIAEALQQSEVGTDKPRAPRKRKEKQA